MFISFLGMVAPLSTDMYLPALPSIAEELSTDASMTSLTLVAFNVFLAFGVLFFGSTSDKYGRKKPLFASLILYGIGSFGCFYAFSIQFLILMRIIQGFGAGGMMSIPLAVCKDYFSGPLRGRILALMQSFVIVAPIFAPLLGALVLSVASWRYCFLVLVLMAIINIIVCFFYEETIPQEEMNKGRLVESFKRIFVVAKNKNFMLLLIICSLIMACFFAYLSSVSYVYEDYFNLTETEFSIYFAINAGLSLLGPIAVILIGKFIKTKIVLIFTFVNSFIVIALMFSIAQFSAQAFLISFVIFGITNSFLRPYATDIMLDLHRGDTGSASGLLNFVFTILGAVGMYVGALPWPNYVLGIAFSMLIFVGLAFLIFVYILIAKNIKIPGLK